MKYRWYAVVLATGIVSGPLAYAPAVSAYAYAGPGGAYAGVSPGYGASYYQQPAAVMPYGQGSYSAYQQMNYHPYDAGYVPSYSGYSNYGGYGNGGYGTGYGPYLPSYPSYNSSYAPYSNYYQAYPQVSHYMTGDTNLLGQQLCRWADYPNANMPCAWDPQQWVYDPWTGSYY